jgi:hypothetical protein
MIRQFAMQSWQNVESAPHSITRMMKRIYRLSWDEISFFDTSGNVFWGLLDTMARRSGGRYSSFPSSGLLRILEFDARGETVNAVRVRVCPERK